LNPKPDNPDETEAQSPADSQARRITRSLLEQVPSVARRTEADAIFAYLDAIQDLEWQLDDDLAAKAIYVSRRAQPHLKDALSGGRVLRVPSVPLSRVGQVKIAVFLALSRNLIRTGDTIVFLSGPESGGTVDTMMVSQVGQQFEMVAGADQADQANTQISPEVLERLIDIAAELGHQGREGKPVGAIFVLGDSQKVMGLSRQMILNPFQGYPRQQRNILDEQIHETVKELASIDGAFIVHGDGTIETCGAYLKTASQQEYELPRGLGTRHHAAAAITAVTDALAVTVSESTGTVTIFRGGRPITEIEKPRVGRSRRRRPAQSDGETH
jgi:DNA integrity scanning protein DisA with diadenylate cyclase activity